MLLAIAPAVSLAVPPTAFGQPFPTQAIDVGAGGAPANGPASEIHVSHDKRTARFVAFVSTATNIVDANTGGVRNVYVAERAPGFGPNGDPWQLGKITIASRSGAPPNGESFGPRIDGEDNSPATCIAFVSKATNLVSGVGDPQGAAYVRDLPNGNMRGFQAPKPVREVAVDRNCGHLFYLTDDGIFKVGLAQGGGGPSPVVSGPGISDFEVGFEGTSLVYSRSGQVYYIFRNHQKSLGGGGNAAISGTGRYAAFIRGGSVFRAFMGQHIKSVGRSSTQPEITLVGNWIVYATGNLLKGTTRTHATFATCDMPISSFSPSGHGNYMGYICSGRAMLAYIGPI